MDIDGNDQVWLVDLLAVVQSLRDGLGLPQLEFTAALVNDTGAAGDGVTADPRISGRVVSGLAEGTTVVAQVRPGHRAYASNFAL